MVMTMAEKESFDKSIKFGEYCVIGENVTIGKNSSIGYHAVIHADTIIGENVRIDDFACIGKLPMKAQNSAVTKEQELPPCKIGDNCIIGTSAIVYRGALLKSGCLAADFSVIREQVCVGEKTIIGKGATIENECEIGSFVKIQTNAYITAYSKIGDSVFIAPGVVTSNDNYAGRDAARFEHFGGVIVKKGGRIGAGATILPGRVIEEDGFVAAGSVVTKDVMKKTIVMGNPAKAAGIVKAEQLLENQ